MDDALESRSGLPDALRVLVAEYPRDAWDSHDNFGPLIRFWLDRHLMFRRLLKTMQGELELALDGDLDPLMLSMRMSRYGSFFVSELHGHHTIEDDHYFPHLQGLESRLTNGFALLDRDHHALDGHLDCFADATQSLLKTIGEGVDWRPACDKLRYGLGQMECFLDRHLTDEEDLIVPVLLKHAPEGLT